MVLFGMIWAPPVALNEKGLTLAGRQQAGRRSRAGALQGEAE